MKTNYDLGKMTQLSGLIFNCPMEKSHDNCPFANLRKMNIELRLTQVANYTNREITMALLAHKNCQKNWILETDSRGIRQNKY